MLRFKGWVLGCQMSSVTIASFGVEGQSDASVFDILLDAWNPASYAWSLRFDQFVVHRSLRNHP